MNTLLISPRLGAKNIVAKRERCWCPYHGGVFVEQAEADLPNGVHFVVMKDWEYHLAIGEWDDNYPPPVVNPDEIEPMLWEALAS